MNFTKEKYVMVLFDFLTKKTFFYIYLYITNMNMKDDKTKLTSIKLLKDVYSSFKKVSFDSEITLQKLVNRTIERYVVDVEFRTDMNEYLNLQISGSQY